MKIKIDGIECEAEPGEYILEIARRNRIDIPSLCHDDALPGQACCRLCLVEVFEKKRGKVVTSCVYPITGEIEVVTNSEKLVRMRKTIIMLLLARAPNNETVQRWARLYSVSPVTRFVTDPHEDCILCGLCVSACEKVGVCAISTVNRGTIKKVSTPYGRPSLSCIGCGACANVCPTGAIKLTEADGIRTIWNKEFELVKCSRCGEAFATREELEHADKRLNIKLRDYGGDLLCERCKTQVAAERMRKSNVYIKDKSV